MTSYSSVLIGVFAICLGQVLCQGRGFGSNIPWKWGKCLVPQIKQNFDTAEFFSGRWYIQKSFGDFFFQLMGVCPTIDYAITDAGEIKVLDYHFEQTIMKYVTVTGTSYTQFIQNGEGYLPITYKLLGGLLQFETPTYIVDTDYNTWALIYTCKPGVFTKTEISWLVSRNRTGWQPTAEVDAAMEKAGLDASDYKNALNIGCGPNEPHL